MNATEDAKRPIRILAVDDNAAALYATSRILRSVGFEVCTASTGTAALAAARSAELVVLDVNLPDMDGFEVCRRLRAAPETARVPILHLSATFTQAADFDIGLAAGADGYLTRPVEPAVLIASVRTLLFARRADAQRLGLDERLRTMFDLAPSGMAILDSQFTYESVNTSYCGIVGCTAEELVGRALSDTPGQGWNEVASRLSQHDRWQGERAIKRQDGSVRHLDWRVAREPTGGSYFVTATDVTSRVQHEVEREQLLASERLARAEAERGNRLKEEFLATLSHELRNPLNAILGWANVLAHTVNLPAQVVTAVEAIQRNGKLQANMIGDLLDYAGITFGKLRLALAPVDPYLSVKAALEIMQPMAVTSGIELHSSFGPEQLTVEGDADRLQQVVWNLISNAIKFSPKGGIVWVAASKQDESFQLAVKDSGKGISEEFLPKVFDRFSQADATTTRRHGGLGIGLAIAKQLVQIQGGSIEAFSEGEGKGATFILRLPLSSNSGLPQFSESQRLHALDLSGAKILLVEDDADARELIRRILSDVGAQVIEARDAKSAELQIAENAANFLISDIGMPDRDGYQLLRELRARGYDSHMLPAIALTAFTRVEDRERALEVGFQDHLTKPVEGPVLVARVAALLRAVPRDTHLKT
jgi:PAS domain S-box-containing protein